MKKQPEQPTKVTSNEYPDHLGLSSDDLSMLNQVLQQVKGISCVSSPAYEIIEQDIAE